MDIDEIRVLKNRLHELHIVLKYFRECSTYVPSEEKEEVWQLCLKLRAKLARLEEVKSLTTTTLEDVL